jgi:DNA-binding NtrC family response regulator
MPKKILVVDDEQSMRDTLQIMLEKEGFEVDTADDGLKALEMLGMKKYDLIITDLKMPGLDGIGMIEEINDHNTTPIIIMTAYATKDQAIAALNLGASYFIEKPFKKHELLNYINRIIKMDDIIKENIALKAELEKTHALDIMIGTSKEIVALKELIRRVGATESTVLLTGESGTGKEIAARALHENSPRTGGPFIPINCGAIPSELLESELFGHVKGSFTGAIKDKIGLMEMADCGTFFLDEVGNTIPSTQMKILRAIQEKEVMPVGGNTPRKVDIRLIAATNENLEEAIIRGKFRKDLYYRLNVINIHIPPLRERKEDIEILFMHFLRSKDKSGKVISSGIESSLIDILNNYSWPGNIRELENVVERMIALSTSGKIGIDLLPDHIRNPQQKQLVSESSNSIPSMDDIEKAYIHWVMTQQNGQKQKAAEILGIGRSTLDRKIEKYGL